MRISHRICALLASFGIAAAAHGQSQLQEGLKDTEVAPHWIYDDLPKAFTQAKASGKPLLVVFRCVP